MQVNLMNRVAFGLLALSCVVAAGGGAYLALRQNQAASSIEVAAWTGAGSVSAETRDQPDRLAPVAESEAVVSEGAIQDAPAPVEKPAELGLRPSPAVPARRTATATPPGAPEPRRPPSRPAPAPRTSRIEESRSAPAPVPDPVAVPAAVPDPPVIEPLPRPVPEAAVADVLPALPEPSLVELTVTTGSVLGLQIDTPVTSDRARVEDRVDARVARDVRVDGEVAIPAGSLVEGSVTLVERGGKLKERARLGVRFHTLVLADGTTVPLSTETIYREGASPAGDSTAKIGGAAVGGAILGAILGGGKGAAIGTAVGVGGGAAAVMAGERNAATLPAGATVTVQILAPVTVTVEE